MQNPEDGVIKEPTKVQLDLIYFVQNNFIGRLSIAKTRHKVVRSEATKNNFLKKTAGWYMH